MLEKKRKKKRKRKSQTVFSEFLGGVVEELGDLEVTRALELLLHEIVKGTTEDTGGLRSGTEAGSESRSRSGSSRKRG